MVDKNIENTPVLNPVSTPTESTVNSVPSAKTAWAEYRTTKKDGQYYIDQHKKFEDSFNGNEFLTIKEVIKPRTLSMLTSDVKTHKLIGVSRECMEEALKVLNIHPKILARRSNALWDLLLASEEQAKTLAGSVLFTKSIRLQTEYMGTCRTRVTIHGVPVDITTNRMGSFFTKYGEVNEVKALSSKSGIETGDMEVQITLDQHNFREIPNTLVCRKRKMLVVVEGRKPCCWLCGVGGPYGQRMPLQTRYAGPCTTSINNYKCYSSEGGKVKRRWTVEGSFQKK